MMDSSDELLTVAEVARYLGVTPHTVYRWISQGRLPATRYSPKVIRVRKRDIVAVRPHSTGVKEPRAAYRARSSLIATDLERESDDVRRSLENYRKLVSTLENRRRAKDEPPKGSPQALLRHAGIIGEEEGEDMLKAIMEARHTAPIDVD